MYIYDVVRVHTHTHTHTHTEGRSRKNTNPIKTLKSNTVIYEENICKVKKKKSPQTKNYETKLLQKLN